MNQGLIPAKWAALTPRGSAIVDVPNKTRMNWSEFDTLVRRLANGLRGLGLEKGDRFAVLSRNCAEYLALYFAAGRAGLVLQPLNWRLAGEELATIVRDAAPKAVISADEWSEAIEQLQRDVDVPHWLQFGEKSDGSFAQFVEAASDAEPIWVSSVLDDDPFFILYTGGTTGKSKGAQHTPPQRRGDDAGADGRRAGRSQRRLHADRADVPHPGRAGDELQQARLPATCW